MFIKRFYVLKNPHEKIHHKENSRAYRNGNGNILKIIIMNVRAQRIYSLRPHSFSIEKPRDYRATSAIHNNPREEN